MEKELFYENLELLQKEFSAPLISLRQAAMFLKANPRTLQADRTFPAQKYGKQYRVSITKLARWLS